VRFDLSETTHLRHVTPRDADPLFDVTMANRAHLAPWMPWAVGRLHPDGQRAFLREAVRQHATGNGFQCAVLDGGRIVGSVGFHRIDRVHGATSIGYWLAEDAQGKGTMTSAVRTLIDHAFDVWDLHRVVIEAAPGNVRSRAVAQRLGFAEEGVLREVERVGDRWVDHVVYGLLVGERP
jgi:ribosomal-protein-serine acetyltransferase